MRHGARIVMSSLNVFGALAIVVGIVPGIAHAADIIIHRDVPAHNVLEQPLPPNCCEFVAIPTEESELIRSLVPGPKMLGDTDMGAIIAAPPSGPTNGTGMQTDVLGHPIDAVNGSQPLSNLPGQGMGSFGSLSGLGGSISGQVGGAIGNAMQGLNGALGVGQ